MLTGLEEGLGLDIVLWLQASGNPLFDAFARLLHNAGDVMLYLGLLVFFFWAVDRRLGIRLVFLLIIATIVSHGLKYLFQTPRPHQLFPDLVVPLVDQGGYGLPSGHTLIATVLWGHIAAWLRDRRVTVIAVAYILLMGWSRMYAGVHYPQDVIGGLLFGGLIVWLAVRLDDPLTSRWEAQSLAVKSALITGVAAAILLPAFQIASIPFAGIVLGAGFGQLWEARAVCFDTDGPVWQRLARFVGGLAVTLLVFMGLGVLAKTPALQPEALFRLIRYTGTAFTIVALWPWLSVRLKLSESRAEPAVQAA